jgi:hypothetical protein
MKNTTPAETPKLTREQRRLVKRAANDAAALQAQVDADNPERVLLPADRPAQGITAAHPNRHVLGPGPGRPSEYTDEEADAICVWVAAGGSLKAYCRDHGRSMGTVYRWMRETTGFQARYAQAHEDRADSLTDEMMDIADGAAVDASIEGVAAAKLRVETRKWIASKLRPTRWGDKQTVEHVGAVQIRIGIPAATPVLTKDMGIIEAEPS